MAMVSMRQYSLLLVIRVCQQQLEAVVACYCWLATPYYVHLGNMWEALMKRSR